MKSRIVAPRVGEDESLARVVESAGVLASHWDRSAIALGEGGGIDGEDDPRTGQQRHFAEGEVDAVTNKDAFEIERLRRADVDEFDELELVGVDKAGGKFRLGRIGGVVHQLADAEQLDNRRCDGARDRDRVRGDLRPLEVDRLKLEQIRAERERNSDAPGVEVGPLHIERVFAASEAKFANVDPAVALDGHSGLVVREIVAAVGGDDEGNLSGKLRGDERSPLADVVERRR